MVFHHTAQVEFIATAAGFMVFASDRAALLNAGPAHAAEITSGLPDALAHRPCWLMFVGARCHVGLKFSAHGPRWWRSLYFFLETPLPTGAAKESGGHDA
jgi:hypothetical protein